jgi:hypothetical protein
MEEIYHKGASDFYIVGYLLKQDILPLHVVQISKSIHLMDNYHVENSRISLS